MNQSRFTQEGLRVDVTHLGKTFRQDPEGPATVVLSDVNLTLEASSVTAVIGESGCGKTTLLRLLAQLTQPDQGSITITRGSVKVERPVIGVVFQEPRLFPWLTVEDNVRLAVRHRPMDEQRAIVNDVLTRVGLTNAQTLYLQELSGGMAQRVGLARALAPQPDLLLLDEAFSALDALTRHRLYKEFEEIRSAQPITTLLVTHDVSEAVRLARRIYRLKQGQITKAYDVATPYPRDMTEHALVTLTQQIFDDFFQ